MIAGVALSPAMLPAVAQAVDRELAVHCIETIRAAVLTLPLGPVLLNSYVVETGAGKTDFDLTQANAAYVYDNALAGFALLVGGFREEAQRIGDALAIAQNHDRFWRDGRLRNAYQAGPMAMPAKLPGWWDTASGSWKEDPYQVGSQSGPIGWAMLLWTALDNRSPANRAADWLNNNLRAPSGYFGGFYGFEPSPQKLTWQSTEQNTDLFAAFSKLSRTGDAAQAGKFVHAMFNPATGVFSAGTSPDGTPNMQLAADAGIWPYLAGLGSATSAATAIASLRRGNGIGFSAASRSIWLEGTAFATLTLQRLNDPLAEKFLATLEQQISPSGYLYACIAPELSTGFAVGPSEVPGQAAPTFDYFRRPALAPTAWAAIAGMVFNPLST